MQAPEQFILACSTASIEGRKGLGSEERMATGSFWLSLESFGQDSLTLQHELLQALKRCRRELYSKIVSLVDIHNILNPVQTNTSGGASQRGSDLYPLCRSPRFDPSKVDGPRW
jgi:hypothetical protein